MPTFTLPLPPHGLNHMNKWNGKGFSTVPAMAAWQRGCKLLLMGWEPPERTSLSVEVVLKVPRRLLRRIDTGKWTEPVIDLVVGARRDQWVDRQLSEKIEGDGTVTITVEVMREEDPNAEH